MSEVEIAPEERELSKLDNILLIPVSVVLWVIGVCEYLVDRARRR